MIINHLVVTAVKMIVRKNVTTRDKNP